MLAPETIRAYEAGRKNPSAAALGRLAAALGCEVGDFYGPLADSEVA